MNNEIFSKVIYSKYKYDNNQDPSFSSNNSFKNLIQLMDNNQSFLNEKKKKKNVPNIKNQLIHKSQSALNIKSYNKNKYSKNKEKENNILIKSYNFKKNLGNKINHEYKNYLNYIYYSNKNHKSRTKYNEKPKINNNDKDSETNFSTTLKSHKKESNKEKLKEIKNCSNNKHNKSNRNIKYYNYYKQELEMPIKLIDCNFNKSIHKKKIYSNDRITNNNLNLISKSNESFSSLKKSIKINSNKREKLNKNFSEYFDDIIELFKNSISSEKIQKNQSLINVNSSNSINSMAENLIKINKKVSKNPPINYRYDSLFDENSFYNCRDILISFSDDDIKKNCKTTRESNKIISETKINNILSQFNNKIYNRNNNKRISRTCSHKDILKTTHSESGLKFNSINSYKNINLSNQKEKYNDNNKNNKVNLNKTVKNDNKNNKYIYKNNIYNSSNSNKPKMKNQKANSIHRKINSYNDKKFFPYNKINFSKAVNFPSRADLLIHNYLILTKSKYN